MRWNGEREVEERYCDDAAYFDSCLARVVVIVLFVVLLILCAFVFVWRAGQAEASSIGSHFVTAGIAGWYGPGFIGEPTKNGERYDPGRLTFAMNQGYPDGQPYTITWYGWVKTPDGYKRLPESGQVCAKWTDTGAFTELYGRVADLSPATMRALAGKDGLYYGLLWVVIQEGCLIIDRGNE